MPTTPATRAMAWVFVHELPHGAFNVGGKPAELPIYRVFLTVPQGLPGITGPLNEQRRNALVREVTELVLAAEGVTDIEAHVHRVWCMLREQSEGFWGANRTHPAHDRLGRARPRRRDGRRSTAT